MLDRDPEIPRWRTRPEPFMPGSTGGSKTKVIAGIIIFCAVAIVLMAAFTGSPVK